MCLYIVRDYPTAVVTAPWRLEGITSCAGAYIKERQPVIFQSFASAHGGSSRYMVCKLNCKKKGDIISLLCEDHSSLSSYIVQGIPRLLQMKLVGTMFKQYYQMYLGSGPRESSNPFLDGWGLLYTSSGNRSPLLRATIYSWKRAMKERDLVTYRQKSHVHAFGPVP